MDVTLSGLFNTAVNSVVDWVGSQFAPNHLTQQAQLSQATTEQALVSQAVTQQTLGRQSEVHPGQCAEAGESASEGVAVHAKEDQRVLAVLHNALSTVATRPAASQPAASSTPSSETVVQETVVSQTPARSSELLLTQSETQGVKPSSVSVQVASELARQPAYISTLLSPSSGVPSKEKNGNAASGPASAVGSTKEEGAVSTPIGRLAVPSRLSGKVKAEGLKGKGRKTAEKITKHKELCPHKKQQEMKKRKIKSNCHKHHKNRK